MQWIFAEIFLAEKLYKSEILIMVEFNTYSRITLSRIRCPSGENINTLLQWFGYSIGLFTERDRDKSCFRIFIELLKAQKRRTGMSSDELAYRLNLSRGTLMHHINRLINAGIVVSEAGKYFLRVDSLKKMVEEIEKDISRLCSDLREMAEVLDKKLGM